MTDPAEELLERAKARFPDLTEPEETLVRKAASGEVANFAGEDEKPTIRAEVLAWLVADPAATEHVHRKGIQLHGAKIEGALDLEFTDLPHPLLMANCVVEQQINLRRARVPALYLHDTQTGPIEADGLRVEGDLFLRNGFHAIGEVRLLGAEIGGNLECDGGKFENPTGDALSADGARVRGDIFLRNEFKAEGEVRLLGAEVGGDLDCDGGRFENPTGVALNADGMRIRGGVFLRNEFVAKGLVRLLSAEVGGSLECDGGRFENPTGFALSADRARIGGDVFLRNGFVAKGGVRLPGAQVDGDLDCNNGNFKNPGGDALMSQGIHVQRNVILSVGLRRKVA